MEGVFSPCELGLPAHYSHMLLSSQISVPMPIMFVCIVHIGDILYLFYYFISILRVHNLSRSFSGRTG